MRFGKMLWTASMITTCLSASGNTADVASTSLDVAKQHARQYFNIHPIDQLKGHSPLTGNDAHDAILVERPEIPNGERIEGVRTEFERIRRNQLIWALIDSYGIDPSLTHFPTGPEEYTRIDSETARACVNDFITQFPDPAFAVIAAILTAPTSELATRILSLARKGNTVAAHYIWQMTHVPEKWYKPSFLEQDPETQGIIQQLSDIGSLPFQYLLARSLYGEAGINNTNKMGILAELGTDAGTDYWGALRYIDLISRNDTNETAASDWLDLFTKTAKLPLCQHIVTRPLHDKSKSLPRGYIDALRQFSEIAGDPIHLVLRKIVENTRSQGLAECYIVKYMYDFLDTKSLSNEEKLAEIRNICEMVPGAKSMLVNIIMSPLPKTSLGYSVETPEERRSALLELVSSGDSRANTILARANAGGIAHHFFDDERRNLGYRELTDIAQAERVKEDYTELTQGRIANIL